MFFNYLINKNNKNSGVYLLFYQRQYRKFCQKVIKTLLEIKDLLYKLILSNYAFII